LYVGLPGERAISTHETLIIPRHGVVAGSADAALADAQAG